MISVNDIAGISDVEDKPTKTYCIDFDKGRIGGTLDDIEAVKQYIKKALITPRYKCLAYSAQYGSEIEAMLITNKWSADAIKKLLPPVIKDTLSDSRIIDVYDFVFSDTIEDCIDIRFTVDTIYGTTNVEEVIPIV